MGLGKAILNLFDRWDEWERTRYFEERAASSPERIRERREYLETGPDTDPDVRRYRADMRKEEKKAASEERKLDREEAEEDRKEDARFKREWEEEFRSPIYKNDPRYCMTFEELEEHARRVKTRKLTTTAGMPLQLSEKFVKPADRNEFQIGDVAPMGDAHEGYVYGGPSPKDGRPLWFAMGPYVMTHFEAAIWAKDQGGRLPTRMQAKIFDNLKETGAFKELFNAASRDKADSFWLASNTVSDDAPGQSFDAPKQSWQPKNSVYNQAICVRR